MSLSQPSYIMRMKSAQVCQPEAASPPSIVVGRGRLVEMEGLRVELRRERHDLRARHRMRLKRQLLPRLEILEIAHAQTVRMRRSALSRVAAQTLNLKSITSPSCDDVFLALVARLAGLLGGDLAAEATKSS